jgi:hypothetical protein
MIEFSGLLAGVVLLLVLMAVATKGWLASRDLTEPTVGSSEDELTEPCTEEFVSQVFSRNDWEFVHGLKTRRVESLFARERKRLALIWMRQTSAMIRKAMREHADAARQSKNLEFRSEISILMQFLILMAGCAILTAAIQTAGPVRLSGLAHFAQRLSQQVTTLQESFQVGVLAKARGAGAS